MRLHCLILVVWIYWIGLVYSQDDDHPEFPVDPETNVCEIFNEEDQTRNMCLKSEFPEETIVEKYGSKVSQCCNGHGFVFTDECNDRPQFRNKEVCGFPNEETPKGFKENNVCPKECRDDLLLLDGDFEVDDGNLQITKFGDFQQKMEVKHYCASYKCDDFDQTWVATVKACVCVKDNVLKEMSDNLDPSLRKCSNPKDTLSASFCNVGNTYSEFKSLNNTHLQAKEPFTDPIVMKKDDESYCVGPKWQIPTNYEELVKNNLFVCKTDTSSEGFPTWAILLIVAGIAGVLLTGFIALKKKIHTYS